MSFFSRRPSGESVVIADGYCEKVSRVLVSPSSVRLDEADAVQVKIVKNRADFAADLGCVLRVGDRVPGARGWVLDRIDRAGDGVELKPKARLQITLKRA